MGASEITKTMIMVKEPQVDGSIRYRRVPWDLITIGETSGLQPVPMPGNFEDVCTTPGTDIIDLVDDMLFDEDLRNDEISEILFFDSESEFLDIYDHVTAYYKTDTGQGHELSYPRS